MFLTDFGNNTHNLPLVVYLYGYNEREATVTASGYNIYESATVRDHMAVLFKYKTMIAFIIIITVLAVTAISYLRPLPYEATAKLLIKPGRQNAPPTTFIQRSAASGLYSSNLKIEDILSEVEIITSRQLIAQTIEMIGPEYLSPPLTRQPGIWNGIKYVFKTVYRGIKTAFSETLIFMGLKERVSDIDNLIMTVQNLLSVDNVRSTNVIAVEFVWPIPEVAADFVNTLLERYQEAHLKMHRDQRIMGFIDDEVGIAKTKLEESEHILRDFKIANEISALGEQRRLLLARKADIESEISKNDALAAELGGRRDALTYIMKGDKRKKMESSAREISLEMQRDHIELEVAVRGFKEKKFILEGNLRELSERLIAFDELESQLVQLSQRRDIDRDNLKLYRTKQEEISIMEKMDSSRIIDIVVLDPAAVPARAKRTINFFPPRVFKILAAFFGSLSVSIMLAFVRDTLAQNLDTKFKAERLTGLKVLASVPDYEDKRS